MKEKIKNCVKIIKLTKLMIYKYADHEPLMLSIKIQLKFSSKFIFNQCKVDIL
jgi:hypothetical protein